MSNRTATIPLLLVLLGTIFNSHNEGHWDTRFGTPGGHVTDGQITLLTTDRNGRLFVAGKFAEIAGVPASHVVMWDGEGWRSLGDGVESTNVAGINRAIVGIALDSQQNVLIGGNFRLNGVETNVARWDGEVWAPIGTYIPRAVLAFTVDADDDPWIGGGEFSRGQAYGFGLLEWDGPEWVKRGPLEHIVSLVSDSVGRVYAGGRSTGHSSSVAGFWDGAVWTELPAAPAHLAISPSGDLFGTNAGNVLRFVDDHWESVGDPASSFVDALHVTRSGEILRGFVLDGTVLIERWAEENWGTVGSPIQGIRYQPSGPYLRAITSGPDGEWYVAGSFDRIGDEMHRNLVVWNGTDWTGLVRGGLGADGPVRAIVVDDSERVFVGGDFTGVGSVLSPFSAVWSGQQWSAIDPNSSLRVAQLAINSQGSVFAAGRDHNLGPNVFARTDNSWTPIASRANGSDFYPWVNAVAVDDSDRIYAAGAFTSIGGVAANGIAMWDGEQWHPLGEGISGPLYHNVVHALAFGPDGDLFAGGDFETAGGLPAGNLARWDGEQWHPITPGLTGFQARVLALAWFNSSLYVGGIFEEAGSVAVRNIGRWDGSAWHPLKDGVNAGVATLLSHESGLYVGGEFEWASDVKANHIARWDGSAWTNVGSGANGDVLALAVTPDGSLYLGGSFTSIDGVPSSHFAAWHPTPDGTPIDGPSKPAPEQAPGCWVYPNPASTVAWATFTIPQTSTIRVNLYDATGRIVKVVHAGLVEARQVRRIGIDVSALASGFYFVEIDADEVRLSAPFVVAR